MYPNGLPEVGTFEFEQWNGRVDVCIRGDPQHGKHLIYTRADARRWFKFRPEILDLLRSVPTVEAAAHLRWGDYVTHGGFICISKDSYLRACDQYGVDRAKLVFVSEEEPSTVPHIDPMFRWKGRASDHIPGIGFLPDFVLLMRAKVLFRAPSTFSWWAAELGNHDRVFSPDQRGISHEGSDRGFQDVPFIEGNHAPLTEWWVGHSELRLRDS
jgi:hypothetical protein